LPPLNVCYYSNNDPMGFKRKRIILHVGLHKTGTTAIQQTLAASNKLLQNQGWKYPVFTDGVRNRIVNHSNPLYTLFCDNPGGYLPNLRVGIDGELARQCFARQLEEELKGEFNLIFSGEDVSSLPEAALKKLAEALSGHELLVIAVVRETYSTFVSTLQHRIHRGVHGLRLEVPSLWENCARLARVFPDLRFLSYEKACLAPGGLFSTFMEECGFDPKPFSVSRENVSIGNHTARFLASFNDYYPLIVNGGLNSRRPQFNVYDLDFDDAKFLLTEAEFSIIDDRVRAENERLSEVTGLTFRFSDNQAFSDSSPISAALAALLLEKAALMPSALINHGFRYISEHDLASEVWRVIRPFPPVTRGLPRFWRLDKIFQPRARVGEF
jgi:hypothetical protein